MGKSNFVPDRDIPDLSGKVIIVTGGNSGIGLETVRALTKHNPAKIYLAARSIEKANAAIADIQQSGAPTAAITPLPLDLASFDSIKAAVTSFRASESRLNILVNNAGVMMIPEGQTKEGYEIQFGTNHMGHALLTQLLLPTLQYTARAFFRGIRNGSGRPGRHLRVRRAEDNGGEETHHDAVRNV